MPDRRAKGLSLQSFAQKAGRIIFPGRPAPFVAENGRLVGSISEKIHVDINGMKQGMFIKSKDATNPVLLFLHGGPGMPEYWLTRRYPTGLENDFTVAWWDQRGAGMSYRPDIPPETMTYEQLISDTLEVTNYLRRRFGKEKIYLMAHSGGELFRHPGGGARAGVVPRLRWHGADGQPTRI